MQYLKESVRKQITQEALKEFRSLGYRDSSIRSIAKNSNTSVGNFYKYFSSKDDLFEKLIGSVYNRLMDYINQFNRVELNEKAEAIFYGLMDQIMVMFKENSTELAVLLNKSEGSKYENCKSSFIGFITDIVTQKVKYELSLQNKILNDNFMIYLMSYDLVESISIILMEKDDGAVVRKLIIDLVEILYGDIVNMSDSRSIEQNDVTER